LHLELTPTTKIFENIKNLNKKISLIGFKAEYRVSSKELVNRAYELLKSANADFVVANDIGKKERGFDTETNEVFVVDKHKKTKHLNLANKRIVGNKILDEIKRIS
jgi:phosphopantothenoylcysteine decarboxylase/phosphopantothenate--cysteine ligase